VTNWKNEFQEKYLEHGPSAFLPKNLSQECLDDVTQIIQKFEQGTASPQEAERFGYMTLAINQTNVDETKPLLEQIDQSRLYQMMNRYADELIFEDLFRRELIDYVQCTETENFYSATRPMMLKIINDDKWPEAEHEFREQLRAMSIQIKVDAAGDISIQE